MVKSLIVKYKNTNFAKKAFTDDNGNFNEDAFNKAEADGTIAEAIIDSLIGESEIGASVNISSSPGWHRIYLVRPYFAKHNNHRSLPMSRLPSSCLRLSSGGQNGHNIHSPRRRPEHTCQPHTPCH